ncbi:hypothetical protein [Accumulibacter sp.]|uniref:hypothetical protein n=1 Tax=Accumulibacter sp. TaxID=2053492 RepID=UPI001DE13FDA|nr:hypothetical protein [Accumulibacter sp.]MCB1965846.1 hypothetical protein [Accumulibacter sp.]MCP5229404.1 hypothetical protein [Accumulibacter sp.]
MKTPLSHDQMNMIMERAHRERNAAIRDLFATLPGKLLDLASAGFEKLAQTLLADAKAGR